LDGQAIALSFVQRAVNSQDVTMEDLSDLFATGRQEALQKAGFTVAAKVVAKKIATDKPRIQMLLTELKAVGSAVDQTAFCSKQRESSTMAMKFAQDSVNQINAEVAAHVDAEAELSDALVKLQSAASAVTESAKNVQEQAKKEESLIQSSQKDQELATRILDQAVTILREVGMSNTTKAVSSLISAQKMLVTQVQSAEGLQRESSATAKAINEQALALTQTQQSEQHNLEFARDDHASQRLQAAENKRLYEADAQEATVYAQKLEESCKANMDSQAAQQRSVQVHALEDADNALAGKLVEAKKTLRGADASQSKPTTDLQNMTPMQRAAAEMGVSSD